MAKGIPEVPSMKKPKKCIKTVALRSHRVNKKGELDPTEYICPASGGEKAVARIGNLPVRPEDVPRKTAERKQFYVPGTPKPDMSGPTPKVPKVPQTLHFIDHEEAEGEKPNTIHYKDPQEAVAKSLTLFGTSDLSKARQKRSDSEMWKLARENQGKVVGAPGDDRIYKQAVNKLGSNFFGDAWEAAKENPTEALVAVASVIPIAFPEPSTTAGGVAAAAPFLVRVGAIAARREGGKQAAALLARNPKAVENLSKEGGKKVQRLVRNAMRSAEPKKAPKTPKKDPAPGRQPKPGKAPMRRKKPGKDPLRQPREKQPPKKVPKPEPKKDPVPAPKKEPVPKPEPKKAPVPKPEPKKAPAPAPKKKPVPAPAPKKEPKSRPIFEERPDVSVGPLAAAGAAGLSVAAMKDRLPGPLEEAKTDPKKEPKSREPKRPRRRRPFLYLDDDPEKKKKSSKAPSKPSSVKKRKTRQEKATQALSSRAKASKRTPKDVDDLYRKVGKKKEKWKTIKLKKSNIEKSASFVKPFARRVLNKQMSLKDALDKVPWWMQDDLLDHIRDGKK